MKNSRHIIYETKLQLKGPILFSEASLDDLDKIITQGTKEFDAYLSDLQSKALERLDSEAKAEIEKLKKRDEFEKQDSQKQEKLILQYQEVEKSYGRYEREQIKNQKVKTFLKIQTGNKYYTNFKSLGDANKSLELEAIPDWFEYEISTGESYGSPKISIKCSKDSFRSIDIDGRPNDNLAVEEVFTRLKRWSEKVTPSKWFYFWTEFGGFASLIVFLTTISLAGIPEKSPSPLAIEINNQIKGGVNSENSSKAIELLLRVASGEKTELSVPKSDKYYFYIFLIGIAMSLFLVIRPQEGVIGIKSGPIKIENWNKWLKFVTYSIPVFLIGYLLKKALDLLMS